MTSKFNLSLSPWLMRSLVICLFVVLTVTSLTPLTSRAQDDERRLWDAEFVKKRQAAKSASAKPAATAKRLPSYRRATPKNNTVDEKAEGEMLGVTVWRLRPSKTEDSQEGRLLLQEEENKEWTPERVEAETTFAPGERVRLGIESPRDGFLYVIDREQYADGTFSEPYLIFPTLRNRNGNNAVTAGKLIEIPEKGAFRLQPMRDDYKGEALTFLITKEPLAEVKIGPSITKLDIQQVAQWEKQWSVPIERFELIGGAGKTYTRAEKEASDGARLLTQEDEMPQTLYRVVAKTGNPILIIVSLRISK